MPIKSQIKRQNSKPIASNAKRSRRNRLRRLARNRYASRQTFKRYLAPANSSITYTPYTRLLQSNDGSSARLEFCELFPILYKDQGVNLIFINPAKWVETRTQIQALIYSQFRPLKLYTRFLPCMGTGTSGSFSLGCIYNNSYPTYSKDLYRQLPQFEGGYMTQLWNQAGREIPCKTRLFQNAFALSNVTDQDIPVSIINIIEPNGDSFDEGQIVGHLAVTGVFSLSGPRVAPEIKALSGTYNATVTTQDNNVLLTLTNPPTNQFNVGDTFTMIVTDENGSTSLPSTQAINWSNVWRVFKQIVCTVIEVANAIVTIRALIPPELLASLVSTLDGEPGGVVEFQIIGRTDFQ